MIRRTSCRAPKLTVAVAQIECVPGDLRANLRKHLDVIDAARAKGAYALTPLVRAEMLENNPELADHLNALSAKLDDATMTRLNAEVDVDRRSIEEVARDFLQEEGLV